MRPFTLFLIYTATAIALPAQTFTTLHSFSGPDGMNPYAGLVQAWDGNYYGTTIMGGTGAGLGGGTIFKMTPTGRFTMLFDFTCPGYVGADLTCENGSVPMAGLIQTADGNLYGTTYGAPASGSGTIFKIALDGTLTTLFYFGGSNGASPVAGLVQAADGNFYGTTEYGGASNPCESLSGSPNKGCGTIYRLTPAGSVTTLYSFCSRLACTDGQNPTTALVQGDGGNLYGTTYGITSNAVRVPQFGTIFKITPTGKLTTLYTFCAQKPNCVDGFAPNGLVHASDGNFYGTTQAGGLYGAGTIFRVTPKGILTTLYSFDGIEASAPLGGALIQATDGKLYGTSNDRDTIFNIRLSGEEMTFIHNFPGKEASSPEGALLQGTDGMFYGTTFNGGVNDEGTIYSLSMGLNPFVETLTTSGKMGTPVKIMGTDLIGTASVSFNGTPAEFKVLSSTLLTAIVPQGATSGKIQVVVTTGSLSKLLMSNVPFHVLCGQVLCQER